jgi:hypothetical protein
VNVNHGHAIAVTLGDETIAGLQDESAEGGHDAILKRTHTLH